MDIVGKYRIENGFIWIDEIQPHAAIKIKSLFKQIPRYERPPYRIKFTESFAEDFEWFLMRFPMESSDSEVLKQKADHSRKTRIEMKEYFDGKKTIDLEVKKYNLRTYQKIGTSSFLSAKRLLIGDDVGLGKTLQAIAALSKKETRPAVIVVQTHLIKQWETWVKDTLDASVYCVKTTNPNKEKLQESDIYIVPYSRLTGWVDVFSEKVKTIIFDEAQELRKNDSQKYQSARRISVTCEYALGLTATPVYNYGNEMFSIIDCINPGSLSTYDEFMREWCEAYTGKIKDPKAFGSYLRANKFFLRRTREDVSLELPVVNKIIHHIPFDTKEFDKSVDIAEKLAHQVLTGSFTQSGQAAREFNLMIRQATGMAKAKFVAEYVKILLENDESVLLMGWHRDVYSVWEKEFQAYNPVFFTGSESGKQKEEAKSKLVNKESKLMIMSLRSGIGLDGLQFVCNTVVFGEIDWSPQVHHQVIGRLDRDGQDKQVNAIFLIADGGSDPPMVDLLGIKNQQSTGIVDPEKEVFETLSDESRIKEIARKFLESRGKKIGAESVDSTPAG